MVARISKLGKKRKQLFENKMVSVALGVVLVAILAFFVYQNVTMNQKRSALEQRLRELEEQKREIALQQEALQGNIANTQTEDYQEKVLREQGLYKKEGEQVVTILPPDEPIQETSGSTSGKKYKWWNPWTWFGAN